MKTGTPRAGRRGLNQTGSTLKGTSLALSHVSPDGQSRANGSLHRKVARETSSSPPLPADSVIQLSRALKKQWQRYRDDLERCQRRFSEKSVHQLRVAARRLLSTVELLERFLSRRQVVEVSACLKQHLDCFDDLRDTQVQLPVVKRL